MQKYFRTQGPGRNSRRVTDSGILKCRVCGDLYHDKRWIKAMDLKLGRFDPLLKNIKDSICPSCEMKKDKEFEGEILIFGASGVEREELRNLVNNFGDYGASRDRENTVLSFDDLGDEIVVKTSDNQMAMRLGEKIQASFPKVLAKISFSQEPYKVTRIKIDFLKK